MTPSALALHRSPSPQALSIHPRHPAPHPQPVAAALRARTQSSPAQSLAARVKTELRILAFLVALFGPCRRHWNVLTKQEPVADRDLPGYLNCGPQEHGAEGGLGRHRPDPS